jgi:hypothetical protein
VADLFASNNVSQESIMHNSNVEIQDSNQTRLLAVVGLCPADEKQVRITLDNDDFCIQSDDSLHDNFDVTNFPNVNKDYLNESHDFNALASEIPPLKTFVTATKTNNLTPIPKSRQENSESHKGKIKYILIIKQVYSNFLIINFFQF